ncbi:MAG: mechanosensitive ion channel family protein [Bacillota bacterium]
MFTDFYQQLTDYWFSFLNYLPTFFAGLAIFIVGWLVALFIRKLVKLGIRVAGIDIAFNRIWYGKLNSRERELRERGWKPSQLLGQAIYWLIIVTALMLSAKTLGLTAAYNLLENFISYIPQILVALVILSLGIYIARRAARLTENFILSIGVQHSHEIAVFIKIILIIITLLAIVDYFNIVPFISLAGFLIIGGSILVSLFVIVLICGRPLISAYIARHSLKSYLHPGMLINFEEKKGRIRTIKTFVTVIETAEETIYYPNHQLAALSIKQLKNNESDSSK